MNLCIISLPRSGSTYTYSVLKHSKYFDNFAFEPFNTDLVNNTKLIYHDKEEHIKLCYKNLNYIKENIKKTNFLMKEIFLFSYDDEDYKNLIKDYFEFINENFKVLKLLRNDVFSSVLSILISKRTKVYNIHENIEKLNFVNKFYSIPLEEFSEELLKRKLQIRKINELKRYDFELEYEELSVKKITYKVSLEYENIDANLLPIKNVRKEDLVLNFKELKDWYEINKDFLL